MNVHMTEFLGNLAFPKSQRFIWDSGHGGYRYIDERGNQSEIGNVEPP